MNGGVDLPPTWLAIGLLCVEILLVLVVVGLAVLPIIEGCGCG